MESAATIDLYSGAILVRRRDRLRPDDPSGRGIGASGRLRAGEPGLSWGITSCADLVAVLVGLLLIYFR